MRRVLVCLVALGLVAAPMSVYAHSGGTDSNGCHVGHCHGGGGGGDSDGGEVVAIVAGVVLLGLIIGAVIWVNSIQKPKRASAEPIQYNGDSLPVRMDGWASEESGGVLLEVAW